MQKPDSFHFQMIIKNALLVCCICLLASCSGLAPVYKESGHATHKGEKSSVNVQPDKTVQIKVVQDSLILKQQALKQQDIAVKSKAKSSNVVVALLVEADSSYQQGNLNASVTTIERALRIESRNALLLYKLATLRLQQGQLELAENLAKKSALLAQGDASLKKKNWLLIAEVRTQMGNQAGAAQARKKATEF